jgi:hypothetical protein
MVSSAVIATSLNKNSRPNTGREFDSRGSTRITPLVETQASKPEEYLLD